MVSLCAPGLLAAFLPGEGFRYGGSCSLAHAKPSGAGASGLRLPITGTHNPGCPRAPPGLGEGLQLRRPQGDLTTQQKCRYKPPRSWSLLPSTCRRVDVVALLRGRSVFGTASQPRSLWGGGTQHCLSPSCLTLPCRVGVTQLLCWVTGGIKLD